MGGLSGRLTLAHGGHDRRFDFLEGRLVYASSLVPAERFATWLATEGVCQPEELRRSLALALLRRTLFSDVLIQRTGVEPPALRASLRRLAETMATRIILIPELRFTFEPAYPVRELLGLSLDLEPQQLLLEAARRTDEGDADSARAAERLLPLGGEAFESFFWELAGAAVTVSEPVDGEQLAEIHEAVRRIVEALAQWVEASPGLVPVPRAQVDDLAGALAGLGSLRLERLPHVVWNQMVLTCSVRSPELVRPRRLEELEAEEPPARQELAANTAWHRPDAGRLDELTRQVARRWSAAAAAAAPHLGEDPGAASLAALMSTVPTDLVLWVLSSLPVPHVALRRALLRLLPPRLAAALVYSADLPDELLDALAPSRPTPLGACLAVAHETAPATLAWPAMLPDWDEALLDVARPAVLARAAAAARKAAEAPLDASGTVG